MALLGISTEARAQNIVTVRVSRPEIDAGKDAGCRVDPSRSGDAKATADSILVGVFTDTTFKTEAATPVELRVLVDGETRGSIASGAKSGNAALTALELHNRTVALAREDAGRPFCARVPLPMPKTVILRRGERTSFVADGAVGASLRGASAAGAGVTGSLGIVHFSPKTTTKRSGKLVHYLLGTKTVDGERLRSYITLTGKDDTLKSSRRSAFADAVLLPTHAGGQIGSGLIDYHPYQLRHGTSGTQGGRAILLVSRAHWAFTAPDDSLTDDDAFTDRSRAADVSIASFDWRYRWAFIDHQDDSLSNNFAFAVEAGLTARSVSVEGKNSRDFRRATLGTSNRNFYGPILGFEIQLRQVTATIDAPLLLVKKQKNDPEPGVLRPFRPVIGFRFDAPFFTF